MRMKQVRMRYSKDFKIKAVELSEQRGNMSQIAQELNVKTETLRLWRKAYNEGKLTHESASKERPRSQQEQELRRLKKELYDVTMERDILKKAVSIFSRSGR